MRPEDLKDGVYLITKYVAEIQPGDYLVVLRDEEYPYVVTRFPEVRDVQAMFDAQDGLFAGQR